LDPICSTRLSDHDQAQTDQAGSDESFVCVELHRCGEGQNGVCSKKKEREVRVKGERWSGMGVEKGTNTS
jgi:hypothetical protein